MNKGNVTDIKNKGYIHKAIFTTVKIAIFQELCLHGTEELRVLPCPPEIIKSTLLWLRLLSFLLGKDENIWSPYEILH